jgi:hypothetical protein
VYIEEVEEEENNNGLDLATHTAYGNNKVPDLAMCTSQFSENQHKQWIEEMNAMGINFRRLIVYGHAVIVD